MGKTIAEAIEEVKKVAATSKGIEVQVQTDSFERALSDLSGLAKLAIKF